MDSFYDDGAVLGPPAPLFGTTSASTRPRQRVLSTTSSSHSHASTTTRRTATALAPSHHQPPSYAASTSSRSHLLPSKPRERERERSSTTTGNSLRSVSTSHSQRITRDSSSKSLFQPFPSSTGWEPPPPPPLPLNSYSDKRQQQQGGERVVSARRVASTGGGGGYDTASESGASVLSAFHQQRDQLQRGGGVTRPSSKSVPRSNKSKRSTIAGGGGGGSSRAEKNKTDSPARRGVRWLEGVTGGNQVLSWSLVIGFVLLVKWSVGLGDYSGAKTPPLRGDLEAQRHWLALTSSSLPSTLSFLPFLPSLQLHQTSSPTNLSIPIKSWYSHDKTYWGLDYPPLTAYHSLLLGTIARLTSSQTATFVSLRPDSSTASPGELSQWEELMSGLEERGEMKSWLRMSVLVGDLLVWVSAVVVFCRRNYRKGDGRKGGRSAIVAALTILLQPGLILIDNGHFQYNSLMLGLTLWSLNCFQANYDLLGAVFFVLSLGFKQMALYYSPAIFAYLLGKCFYLGRPRGLTLFLSLGLTVLSTFLLLLLPFLSVLPQLLTRIFPFQRGLFEDKVANVWCALNTVVKLRDLASIGALVKLSLVMTGLAVLPSAVGLVWISYQVGRRTPPSSSSSSSPSPSTTTTTTQQTPTFPLLPHTLLISSLSFFLLSFQVHEKTILLPLMPLTLLMGAREAGWGRQDWEWGVLVNNVGVFSMFPLLSREGLSIQYFALLILWNYLIGYNPFTLLRPGTVIHALSLTTYALIILLHLLESITTPPPHLPDLFAVANLTLSAGVFGITWLWAGRRAVMEGWGVVGVGGAAGI